MGKSETTRIAKDKEGNDMRSFVLRTLIALTTACMVVACGGGGGGSTSVAGIDRLGVSSGSVTGFGSIFVNGVEFETDSSDFDINDDSIGSSQNSLSVGDVVVVTYNPSQPNIALSVIGDEAVEGRVDSIDAAAGIIVVVGQTVKVDAETTFDDSTGLTSLTDLAPGNFVEVSGFVDGDGTIRATRIERKAVAGEVEVHGLVSGKTANTFFINALQIDYTTVPAIIDDDFPGGTFANGDLVEVKGTSFNGAILLATKVEPDGFGVGAGGQNKIGTVSQAEVEGYITQFVSAVDFDVAGFPITTTPSTVFDGGTVADLGVNVKVEVEGSVNASGVLVATKVDIRRTNDLRVVAQVDDDPTANTLTLLGIVVRIDALTRMEDKSNADQEPFNLGHINAGDYVEVRGSTDTGGADIIALLVERDDLPGNAGEDTELRALVEAINRPLITLAGVTVDTTGAQFRDIGDAPISADAFFAALNTGDLVDVKGDETGATAIDANEVGLENF